MPWFQSAPAIDGGRSRHRDLGAADHRLVSIRARHRWRAIPAGFLTKRAIERVSIRARHRWRAIQLSISPEDQQLLVSIRARHRWRAIHRAVSPPARAARRFNPRPPSMAGDPYQVIGPTGVGMVSIRARHRWRAIPDSPERARSRFFCFNPRPPSMAGDPTMTMSNVDGSGRRFNPRPPSMAGDPVSRRPHRGDKLVSIRARHRWRAIPGCQWAQVINRGFNPRPPSMAGDPAAASVLENCWLVSIRARHRWRAIRASRLVVFQGLDVSIRARHRWRAIPRDTKAVASLLLFQSAPAIDGGRSHAERAAGW